MKCEKEKKCNCVWIQTIKRQYIRNVGFGQIHDHLNVEPKLFQYYCWPLSLCCTDWSAEIPELCVRCHKFQSYYCKCAFLWSGCVRGAAADTPPTTKPTQSRCENSLVWAELGLVAMATCSAAGSDWKSLTIARSEQVLIFTVAVELSGLETTLGGEARAQSHHIQLDEDALTESRGFVLLYVDWRGHVAVVLLLSPGVQQLLPSAHCRV